MFYYKLDLLLKTSTTSNNFFKKLQYEFKDLFDDFADFFDLIKTHTYDILCQKFDPLVVNMFGIGLIFLLIMLIATKIINK